MHIQTDQRVHLEDCGFPSLEPRVHIVIPRVLEVRLPSLVRGRRGGRQAGRARGLESARRGSAFFLVFRAAPRPHLAGGRIYPGVGQHHSKRRAEAANPPVAQLERHGLEIGLLEGSNTLLCRGSSLGIAASLQPVKVLQPVRLSPAGIAASKEQYSLFTGIGYGLPIFFRDAVCGVFFCDLRETYSLW